LGINHEWRQASNWYIKRFRREIFRYEVRFSWSSEGTHGDPTRTLQETRAYYHTTRIGHNVTDLPSTYLVVTNGNFFGSGTTYNRFNGDEEVGNSTFHEGTYNFRLVKVYNMYGFVVASDNIVLTISQQFTLPDFPSLNITDITTNSMRINWTFGHDGIPSENPFDIRLYYKEDRQFFSLDDYAYNLESSIDISSYTNNYYDISNLTPNKRYFFSVRIIYTVYGKIDGRANATTNIQFP
jgi:hypothetical protein